MASRSRLLAALTAAALTALTAGCAAAAPSAAAPAGAAAARPLPAAPAAAPVTLTETGSTLLLPLLQTWAKAYHARYSRVQISTAGTGSGEGIADASDGKVTIGASDAYLSSGNLVSNPALLNIPLAISAQQVNYNLPQLPAGTHLRLTGAVLAQMYDGTITSWNARPVAALNPGVQLPAIPVVPLHRKDSSGDTFLFSSYLATTDPAWNAAIGYGTTVAWPTARGARSAEGNSGMVQRCATTPGCVAYIGISYLSQATQRGLGYAALANADGRYELPDKASMAASAAAFVGLLPPNETISMVNGPAADGYPIVNYEYAIVSMRPRGGRAASLRQFLGWAITQGNSARYLGPVQFQPLPPQVVSLARAQIARIR